MSGGDYPVIGAGIDVEVVETRSAGWAFRCHPCDITTVNLTEAEARTLHNGHVHRAADLGDMLRRGRIEIKSGDEGNACGLKWSDARVGPHECKDPSDHKPGMHSCVCGTYLVGDGGRPGPWRFDVPEVPDSVTAIKGETDVREHIFVRLSAGWWRQWSTQASCLVGEPLPTREILEYAPLVECEDPRAAS